MHSTENNNIKKLIPLISPNELKEKFPLSKIQNETVLNGRKDIRNILDKKDKRLLMIVGPCSIHDEKAALEYAEKLNVLRQKYEKKLCIVMRVYFEKPRTTVGWKGLIADPHLDGTHDVSYGLTFARNILQNITAMGLPVATELLDPIVPQYIADLISWTAVGARTTESQTHREMASGLSMPVGFKNSTSGNLTIAIDAMQSARHPHSFLGITDNGNSAIVKTHGNAYGHVILRGGDNGPNYSPAKIRNAADKLIKREVLSSIIVDCSHANSEKKFQNQEKVLKSVLKQRAAKQKDLVGVMVESNLDSGNQKMSADSLDSLKYGISVTDECVGWDMTEAMLESAFKGK